MFLGFAFNMGFTARVYHNMQSWYTLFFCLYKLPLIFSEPLFFAKVLGGSSSQRCSKDAG